ncbi:hypothetical protein FC752_03640 [Lysinibacillus varians]|uniref:Uncharacterized protein n=1 Tax=Lysinibacillus varians TaxID=1145276 RepID=A0ABY2TE19_9BACI|nr:hypothetical protein FC752_03640 [Lysinibacillus varians]
MRYRWRFPRASTEPLPSLRSVQGLGLLAFPAGVATFRSIELVISPQPMSRQHLLFLYIVYILHQSLIFLVKKHESIICRFVFLFIAGYII